MGRGERWLIGAVVAAALGKVVHNSGTYSSMDGSEVDMDSQHHTVKSTFSEGHGPHII
jgi:hypothetical protein